MNAYDSLVIALKLLALRRSERWGSGKILARQGAELVRMLRYAVDRVPYYRDLGIEASGITTPADLRRFPVLSKEQQRAHMGRLLADGVDEGACFESRTSGSTGEPTTVLFDRDCWLMSKYAVKIRRMTGSGLGLGKRVLQVSERTPEEIRSATSLFGQGLLFGQRHISIHEPVERGVEAINEYRPDAIYAFPSYLAELLEYSETHGIELRPVGVVFTSSETLSDGLRRRLSRAFQATVVDIYGCTEFKEIAWQCDEGGYHINFESVWVEVDNGGSSDECGSLLLTSLINRAMPLIRYRVGDIGSVGPGPCRCGRAGPLLTSVRGREVDMLHLPDGRRLSPYLLTTVVESERAMRRYQIVQVAPSRLEVRYLVCAGGDVDESRIRHGLQGVLGTSMTVGCRRLAEIPRPPNGKQKVFFREFEASSEGRPACGEYGP